MPFKRVVFPQNQFPSPVHHLASPRPQPGQPGPPGKEDAEDISLAKPLPAKLPNRHQVEAAQVTGILEAQGGLRKALSLTLYTYTYTLHDY